MSDQPKRFFDLWFMAANNVVKEVPFHVVTDWCQQGRAVPDDQIKPSGTSDWYPLGSVVAFQPYFPKPEPNRPRDAAEAMAPVEMDLDWPTTSSEEDEDVDMIPLIDISLVLLIFFMMTMAVAAVSRISVPDAVHFPKLTAEPETLRIDIDWRDGKPFYAIGIGVNNPAPEDDNLTSEIDLKTKLDEKLSAFTTPPKVRVAAHGDTPSEIVGEILNALELRQRKGQVNQYAVEVNERSKL